MEGKRRREAELIALSLYDKPVLRAEFWRVVCKGGKCREMAWLPSRELIHAILEVEFPSQRRVTTEQNQN